MRGGSEVRGQESEVKISRLERFKNTVLARKTAPVLILNMHLAGRIASCSLMRTYRAVRAHGLLALLARKTAPHGLLALWDGLLEIEQICVLDGVLKSRGASVTVEDTRSVTVLGRTG
jgi:hypothetical protein